MGVMKKAIIALLIIAVAVIGVLIVSSNAESELIATMITVPAYDSYMTWYDFYSDGKFVLILYELDDSEEEIEGRRNVDWGTEWSEEDSAFFAKERAPTYRQFGKMQKDTLRTIKGRFADLLTLDVGKIEGFLLNEPTPIAMGHYIIYKGQRIKFSGDIPILPELLRILKKDEEAVYDVRAYESALRLWWRADEAQKNNEK